MKKLLLIFLLTSCTQLTYFNIDECEITEYRANTLTEGLDAKITYTFSGDDPITLKLFIMADREILGYREIVVGYNTLITYYYEGKLPSNYYLCAVWIDDRGKKIREYRPKRYYPIYE
jgi:hypothetical protein